MNFSLVCPIKDEVNLIPVTLPSFYAVDPAEVILCLDDPAPPDVVETINQVAARHSRTSTTRIIKVKPNSEYTYQQAWIRRTGFTAAEHNRILNSDIDLLLNRNVLKLVEAVGKNNVGLASINKKSKTNTIGTSLQQLQMLLRYYLLNGVRSTKRTFFTGLYALWRPYWIDSEPPEKIKRFLGIKQIWRGEKPWLDTTLKPRGEDSHLKECMQKRHRCIFFPEVGATILRENPRYNRYLQYMYGQHAGMNGGSLRGAIQHSLVRHRTDYLRGYLEVKA